MADPNPSGLDIWLDRLSKVAGILLPITIGLVGGAYTIVKDRNDESVRVAQQKRDTDQKAFDNTQKQYSNLTALLPLLTSEKETQVQIGLEMYTSEAKALQAPTDLQPTIRRLANTFPQQAQLVQVAAEAGQRQQAAECTGNADGIYIEVANSKTQLQFGEALAGQLRALAVSPPVQGVQRIDRGPANTELRYYFSEMTNAQAVRILSQLSGAGLDNIHKVDLSGRYLKKGCPTPAVFELWIGTSSPLGPR